MTESVSEILLMTQKALYHCKTKTDPLRQEQLFSCIEVALNQIERGIKLCRLALDHELVQEARKGNEIARIIIKEKLDGKSLASGEKDDDTPF